MASPMMMETTLITLREFSLVWPARYGDGRGFHLLLLHGKFLEFLAFFLGSAFSFLVLCFSALRACDCYCLATSWMDTTIGNFIPISSIDCADSATVRKDRGYGSHYGSCNCRLKGSGVHRKSRGLVAWLVVSG